ncbi:MAG: hypothetical protein ACM3US_12755 [Sphingomonadaceae bacterium]
MLSVRLDPDLEELLDREVDDLARYNILRYLHERPQVWGSVAHFSDELGLRSPERTGEALEALTRAGLLVRVRRAEDDEPVYGLNSDPAKRDLVTRMYRLSFSSHYGAIVERLAAKSLRRARKAQSTEGSTRRTAAGSG